MKLIQVLTTTLLIALTHAAPRRAGSGIRDDGDADDYMYCNRGWSGNGDCDATPGVFTFCCNSEKGGNFQYAKKPIKQGYAPDGHTDTCYDGGTIWCAN